MGASTLYRLRLTMPTLYSLSLSPPARAAQLMLEHKAIEHRVVNLIPPLFPGNSAVRTAVAEGVICGDERNAADFQILIQAALARSAASA